MPEEERTWVSCDGGPLILIPRELLGAWEGANAPSGGRVVTAKESYTPHDVFTDYDRACERNDFIWPLPVAAGVLLVLDDGETPATWIPGTDGDGGYLFQGGVPDEAKLGDLVMDPSLRFELQPFSLLASGEPYILMAAADAGSDPWYTTLRILLRSGEYRVETAPINEGLDHIHRFTRIIG